MSIEVETKDCTGLSDAELGELADLCAECTIPHEIGTLTKEAEAWVLVTQARDGGKLKGFTYSTLERIGGTPCVLIGVGAIKQNAKRDTVLRAMMAEELRRAVLAFPDEDVLVATRMRDASPFEAFKPLFDIVPRDGHKVSGEERAWGRRLAKRFGVVPSRYGDRKFQVTGDGTAPLVFDHVSAKPSNVSDFDQFFEGLDTDNGDYLIGFGWALAEELDKLA
ncbi:MAG: hypothetical protein U5K30_00990 [Acidimicrobiales bacterium]|nr:hypothetical protein [Acidimicrobiales bacterium]